jgi:putative ABC transport system permease protein
MWVSSLRLALREIRNHPRFSAFFALNLALGFAGFVALDAFERSVSGELEARSRSFLGADLAVNAGRVLRDDEVASLDALAGPGADVARVVELFSMVAGGGTSRLVEVHAIEENFPLRGEIVLEGIGPVGPDQRAALDTARGAWVDPALLSHLGIEVGAPLRIGHREFVVQGVVARDGGRASSGFSMAPRLYIAFQHLEGTGLVATGSRLRHRRLYAFPEDVDADALAIAMRTAISDERVTARSHAEATRDLTRTFGAVSDYLGLVSLVAIFLAGLGAAYLFRAFLGRRLREVAILISVGATRTGAQATFLAQLSMLAVVAAVIACGLGALLLPLVVGLVGDLAPRGFEPRVGIEAFLVTALLATVGSACACLPLLMQLRRLRPAELFAEQVSPTLERGPREALLLLPAALFIWAVAVWRSESLLVGSVFAGVLAAALGVLALLGSSLISSLAAFRLRRALSARLALRELVRRKASNVAVFVALALCTLLVGVPPQMRGVLEGEMETPETSKLPSLFLFDIQPEQVESLSAHVSREGARLARATPMVRAQLAAINGEPVQRQRREDRGRGVPRSRDEEAQRLRSRRYNLTYNAELSPTDRLIEGVDFSGVYDSERGGPAEMSLELEFAEHLELGIGDTLDFDVQGVPVTGRVVNLREVRWNSFQPSFFVSFQPGVLEEAPAVYLATVPRLSAEAREALQTSIVAAFPNVSAIDVSEAVRRVMGLLEQLHWAITSTASLSLLVGLALIYAIARDRARARRWATNLLKVLGADFPVIRRSVDVEFGLLALLAGLAGSAGAIGAAAMVSRTVFETPFRVSLGPVVLALVAVPLVCVLTGRFATRSVLRERPLALLQS